MSIRRYSLGRHNPIYLIYLKYLFSEVFASTASRLVFSVLIMFFATFLIENFISRDDEGAPEIFYLAFITVVLTVSGCYRLLYKMREEMRPLVEALPINRGLWLFLDSSLVGLLLLLVLGPFVVYLYNTHHEFYVAHWLLLFTLPLIVIALYYIQGYTERQTVALSVSLGIVWFITIIAMD